MPKCKICGEWFVGGENPEYPNLCLYCWVRVWSEDLVMSKRKRRTKVLYKIVRKIKLSLKAHLKVCRVRRLSSKCLLYHVGKLSKFLRNKVYSKFMQILNKVLSKG